MSEFLDALLGHAAAASASHPGVFALRSDGTTLLHPSIAAYGQPCLSSNLTEEIYQDAVALLTGQAASSRNVITPWGVVWDPTGHTPPKEKTPGIFGMMPQDGFTPCRCPECSKHFSKGLQETSDFIWGKVAEVAAYLKRTAFRLCLHDVLLPLSTGAKCGIARYGASHGGHKRAMESDRRVPFEKGQ